MLIQRVHARTTTKPLMLLLSIATLFAATESAQAQYHYVPAPGYYRNDTAEGTFVGGAVGALTGALLGGNDHRGEGALIGAGVGALTGNVLGRNQDRLDEQRAANGAYVVDQANRQAAAQAITNVDLIRLAQARVSDEIIISAIRSRGARLDLSPNGLISLKQSGVSDRVLIAAQQFNARPAAISHYRTVPVVPVRPTVIVAPRPYRVYHHQPHYYEHHHHGGSRVHYRFGF